jgi:hypothetical protein
MNETVQPAIISLRGWVFWLCAALLCQTATPGRAEVRIEGTPAEIRVTTSNDAISDVLSAFTAKFKVKYDTAIALDSAAAATYSGSIRQVISHLLQDYNYVLKIDQQTIDILILGRRGESAIPPPVPAAKGIVSQWR